jgi:hypothetical protein
MDSVVELLVLAAFGAVVSLIAQSRGRSAIGWFVIGFFFTCIGLILVLVLPDLKAEEAQKRRLRTENRRLRERLAKDRQVADERHARTERRLGAHDAVLGLDTAREDRPPPMIADDEARPTQSIPPDSRWHYALTGDTEPRGPVTFETLRELWNAGTLNRRCLVWTKGMESWVAIGDHDELSEELRSA